MMSVRVGLDNVADYVPLVSTVNNLVDLFQKYVYLPRLSDNEIQSNHYYTHLKDKSLLRIVILCLPILVNNLIILVIDVVTLFNKWERDGALETARGGRVDPAQPNLKVELWGFSHDKEIVLAAVRKDPENFRWAVSPLKDDPEVVRAALTNQKAVNLESVLPYIGPTLKQDADFMISILPYFEAKRVKLGEYCPELLNNQAFSQKLDELEKTQRGAERAIALALVKDGFRIVGLPDYMGDREFVLAAVRHHYEDLFYCSKFYNDEDVVEAAIQNAGTPDNARRVMDMWAWQLKDNPDFMKRIEQYLLDR